MASLFRAALTSARLHGSNLPRVLRTPSGVTLTSRRHLPVCMVETNLPEEGIPDNFNKDLSALVASTLNKTEPNITVSLRTKVRMCRAGNEEPTASVHIWSIGVFDVDRNPGYSKALYAFLEPALGIPAKRITLMLHPIAKETAGHLLYYEMMDQK